MVGDNDVAAGEPTGGVDRSLRQSGGTNRFRAWARPPVRVEPVTGQRCQFAAASAWENESY